MGEVCLAPIQNPSSLCAFAALREIFSVRLSRLLLTKTNPREIGRNTYSKAVIIHALNVSSAKIVIDVVIAVNFV